MYKINDSQKFMYFADKSGAGQALLLCGSLLFPSRIDSQKLQDALNELFRINDGLRTVFIEKDEEVYQDCRPFERKEFEVKRFSNKQELDDWASVYATIPLKLDIHSEGSGVSKETWKSEKPSLTLVKNVVLHNTKMFFTKLSMGMLNREKACCEMIIVDLPETNGVIFKIHHVVGDAWAIMLIANQLMKILDGKEVKAFSFKQLAEKEDTYIGSDRHSRDIAYMKSEYEKCPEATWLWPEHYTSLEATRRTVILDEDLTSQIMDYCKASNISPFTLFQAAICIYMRKRLKRNLFYVGSVALNRNDFQEKNTVSMFVTSSPVLIEMEDDFSFADLLNHVRLKSIGIMRHHRGAEKNADSKKMLYDIWVSYQNAKLDEDVEVDATQYYCNYSIDTTIFTIEDRSSKGKLKLHFDHNIKVPESDVDELFDIVISTIKRCISDKDVKIAEL